MKASDYIIKFLEKKGVKLVFEMSGGMIAHLLDSLAQQEGVRAISVHHEQTAAFAAEAYGRLTGIPGVAMATSGPGATNLLTGIGSCFFDSTPAIFITGQVNRHEQKGGRAIRQLGFQETDIVAMAKPITKAAWLVQSPEELPVLLEKAFQVATQGRPGPVLLDVPMDVQRADIADPSFADAAETSADPFESAPFLADLFQCLGEAKRPLLLVGGGIRSSGSLDRLRQLVDRLGVPVVTSLMGIDAIPYEHPLRVGMIGSYGNRWANIALGNSDLLLVLGSRLDVRQTGSETVEFKGARAIFHVDCEAGEVNNRVLGCKSCVCDLGEFVEQAIQFVGEPRPADRSGWIAELQRVREQWPDTRELSCEGINPDVFMHELSRRARDAAAYVTDVGQHQMWAAQSLEIGAKQRFLTSGGMGSMGFGLPAALGAALVTTPRPVVLIAGDGGFQANIQELQTVARNKLPVKMVIMDNGCHGMVRQFQESYFEGRYQSTLWGYSAPDFAAVAEAYGISSRAVKEPEHVPAALEWFWRNPEEPALLHVVLDPMTNVYPKLAFGRPITEMEPFIKPLGMEGT